MSNDNKTLNRVLGGTEYSWCKAVPGGTGITVLALLLSKKPDLALLQNALHNLQNHHPILNSKISFNSTTKAFSFASNPSPTLQIQPFDPQSTAQILRELKTPLNDGVSDFHLLLEHELNRNAWANDNDNNQNQNDTSSPEQNDVFFASLYELGPTRWALALRLHTAACDRTAATALLRGLMREIGGSGAEQEFADEGEGSLAIEDLVPKGKGYKVFWARGIDMLGYSLNSFRLMNLEFRGPSWPRGSQLVRLRMDQGATLALTDGCKSRGIKLSAVLVAAALIGARSLKTNIPKEQNEKYGVVTLIDCRSILEPPLSNNHLGFYHSAILNTHDITGSETLWGLAKRTHESFANAVRSNKHFSDMNDLNFLMCKAIENPGMTPSSSLRTAFVSIFEDPVTDPNNDQERELQRRLGFEDCIGCSSVHGVGPSIAIFDTIRAEHLDCALVYPSPLHSRAQMEEIVQQMKRILLDSSSPCTTTTTSTTTNVVENES